MDQPIDTNKTMTRTQDNWNIKAIQQTKNKNNRRKDDNHILEIKCKDRENFKFKYIFNFYVFLLIQ